MKTYNGSEEQRKEIMECEVLVAYFRDRCPIYTTDRFPLPMGVSYECITEDEFQYRMRPHDKETPQ
jgi:hypothetical protein